MKKFRCPICGSDSCSCTSTSSDDDYSYGDDDDYKNSLWTRSEGLVKREPFITRSLLSAVRTGESVFLNGKKLFVRSASFDNKFKIKFKFA